MKQIITFFLILFTTVGYTQDELIFDNCGADQLYENINNYDAQFESYYQSQLELKSKKSRILLHSCSFSYYTHR